MLFVDFFFFRAKQRGDIVRGFFHCFGEEGKHSGLLYANVIRDFGFVNLGLLPVSVVVACPHSLGWIPWLVNLG